VKTLGASCRPLLRLSPLALIALCAGCSVAPRAARLPADPDSIPDAYAVATGALMRPGATRSFLVDGAGDLFNGAWWLRATPTGAGAPADSPRAIAAEGRWRPVLHWRRHAGAVRWDFEAAALPGLGRRDTALIVSWLATATNSGEVPAEARLVLRLTALGAGEAFVAPDLVEPVATPRWGAPAARDSVHGWCELAADGDSIVVEWRLAPGESQAVRCVLPSDAEPNRALARWAATPHATRMDQAREDWRRIVSRGTQLSLRDPEVEAAWKAAIVVLQSCRARRGERWAPVGGPFHYRDTWLRDGARAVRALAIAGHGGEAREAGRALMELQWPNGAVLSQRGQLDGTGQALWALNEAYLRTPAGSELRDLAPAIERAAGWILNQRELGRSSTEGELGAMLPFAEPRDNEFVRAQLTGNDAWAIAGLDAASDLLAAAGRGPRSRELAEAARAYRADFERQLSATHGDDVPPSWQGIGRDWGNLAVGFPCRVLPPSHPRLAALARRVWAQSGGAGLATYAHFDSLHGYNGVELGEWALLAGRTAEADSVLSAMLHWRTASGGAGEVFSRAGGYGGNLPPHPTSAAALVSLVRDALIEDGSDTLRLTLGARPAWWRGAKVSRAPTRWGALDLRFVASDSTAEWRWSPVPAWTALTLPPGCRLAGAAPEPLIARADGRVVMAPPGVRTARLAISGSRP
jgi:hypothetical protein